MHFEANNLVPKLMTFPTFSPDHPIHDNLQEGDWHSQVIPLPRGRR